MPLPFLRPKAVGAVITTVRKPDGQSEIEQPEDDSAGLNAAAADLIRAVHAKDEAAVAAAMRAAFEIMESQPHEEGPHIDEEMEGNE